MNAGLDNALKLIEDQRLHKCWSIYCSEIDIISEACLMLLLMSYFVRLYQIGGLVGTISIVSMGGSAK